MTNEELERIMNFIIERQERAADQLAETENILAELARRDDDKEQRIARFERSYTVIADLLQRHDTQIVALTDGLNRLTETVNRYITARGDGDAGNGQP
jgi:ABC-type transporter Mla subunit MlaD